MGATATAERPAKQKTAPAPTPSVMVDLNLYRDEIQSIYAVALAASTDSVRRPLTGINFTGDGENVTITATDSYRLHQAIVPFKTVTFEATIPAAWLTKTIREVKPVKPVKKQIVPPTVLSIAEGRASISNDAETRSVKLIEDKYPNHQTIVESNEERADAAIDTELMVDPRYFADVLNACQVFAGNGCFIGARFKVTGETTPVSYKVVAGGRTFLGLLMPLRMSSY